MLAVGCAESSREAGEEAHRRLGGGTAGRGMVGGCDRRYIGEFEGGALICGDGAAGWRGWWGRSSGREWGDQDGAEWREGG